MPTDSDAVVNPLIPAFEATVEDGSDLYGGAPAGLGDDATPIQLSSQAWAQMHPQQQSDWLANVLTGGGDGSDDGNDNFNNDVQLDSSQAEWGGPAAPPGWAPPPPVLPKMPIPPDKEPPAQESRFDDIGYRVSELFKGHLQNFLNPDRNLPPQSIPVTPDQIGTPSAVGANVPEAVKAPQSEGFYSADPGKWKYVSDDPTRVQKILDVANSMIGVSSAPADLIRQAYAAAGIDLPNVPDFQLDAGDRVPLNKLKPGDLVAWSGGQQNSSFVSNVGIMLMDGKVIKAPVFGEGPRVFNLYDLPRSSIVGSRIPGSGSGGSGVSLSNSPSYVAQTAAHDAVAAVQKLIGGLFGDMHKEPKRDSGGNNKGGGKSSNGSGKGSKFYGSDQKNTGNSSKKYSGIGATK